MDAPLDRGATLQGHTHVSHADTLAHAAPGYELGGAYIGPSRQTHWAQRAHTHQRTPAKAQGLRGLPRLPAGQPASLRGGAHAQRPTNVPEG